MLAAKRSPLFRIALLSFAVLFAHTGRAANVQHSFPGRPPCPRKVAAAQPDTEKKLTPALKRLIRPGRRVHFHTSFADPPGHNAAAAFRAAQASAEPTLAPGTGYIAPQRRPFALRI